MTEREEREWQCLRVARRAGEGRCWRERWVRDGRTEGRVATSSGYEDEEASRDSVRERSWELVKRMLSRPGEREPVVMVRLDRRKVGVMDLSLRTASGDMIVSRLSAAKG